MFWSSGAIGAEVYLAGFKKLYPWLEVETWMASNTEIAEKAMDEAKARRYSVDVLGINEDVIVGFPKELLAKYEWPNVAKWPAEVRRPEGLYIIYEVNVIGPVYNSKLVPATDVPKSWEDLKNPRFKGKTAASITSDTVPLMLAALWGSSGNLAWEKSFAFWQEVVQNTQPKIVSGYASPTALLGAGDFQLFLMDSGAVAVRNQLAGGLPVALAPFDRLPTTTATLAIVQGAPHPNAARLLADYMTSANGATAYADTTFSLTLSPEATSSRPYQVIKERGINLYLLPVEFMTAETMNKSRDFWKKTLGVVR